MARGGPEEDSIAVYVVPKYTIDMSREKTAITAARRFVPYHHLIIWLAAYFLIF